MSWVGRKKIAFIPLYRTDAAPPDQIPSDWPNLIYQRVFFDPNQVGADRSLRAYIHAASSGLADFDAVVLPMQTIAQRDVPVDALDAQRPQLQQQGFDAAALVMLGGAGAGTSQAGGFWARFVMVEGVGTWAMECMHVLTGFRDLYTLPGYKDSPNGDMGAFDEMACNCATHPSAYTKAAIKWLNPSTIAQHPSGLSSYDLYSVGLIQPPPEDRVAAVQIGSQVPYLMVEARQRVDQFDVNIPSEGVIVYRIQTSDPNGTSQNNLIPVFLLTTRALSPGGSFTSDSGVTVNVTGALPGGFSVTVDSPDPNTTPWTSVSEGRTTPGGCVTAVVTGRNQITLFLADPNGGVYTTSGNASAGWAPWTSVSEGRTMPGAPVTAVVTGPNHITLFLADPGGGVYTTSGTASAGWAPWTSVAQGSTMPGAPVTALLTGSKVAVFLSDPGGGVYTASGNASVGWGQWSSVAQGSTKPGGTITAVVTGSNQITLFLSDPGGGVYTASGNANAGWGQWSSVAEGSSTPGAQISAVVTGPNQIALFLADEGGGVYTASGNANAGWGQWSSVSEGSTMPGAPVSAVVTGPNQIALFLADRGGGVYAISGNANAGWGLWRSVSQGSSTPGAPITAVVTGPEQVALFLADPSGGVYTSTKKFRPL